VHKIELKNVRTNQYQVNLADWSQSEQIARVAYIENGEDRLSQPEKQETRRIDISEVALAVYMTYQNIREYEHFRGSSSSVAPIKIEITVQQTKNNSFTQGNARMALQA